MSKFSIVPLRNSVYGTLYARNTIYEPSMSDDEAVTAITEAAGEFERSQWALRPDIRVALLEWSSKRNSDPRICVAEMVSRTWGTLMRLVCEKSSLKTVTGRLINELGRLQANHMIEKIENRVDAEIRERALEFRQEMDKAISGWEEWKSRNLWSRMPAGTRLYRTHLNGLEGYRIEIERGGSHYAIFLIWFEGVHDPKIVEGLGLRSYNFYEGVPRRVFWLGNGYGKTMEHWATVMKNSSEMAFQLGKVLDDEAG